MDAMSFFEADIDEWANILSRNLAWEIRKFRKHRFLLSPEEKYTDLEIAYLVKEIALKVKNRIIKGNFLTGNYIAIVEGSLGTGKRACVIKSVKDFTNDLEIKIFNETIRLLNESIETGKEIKKPEKRLEYTNFEYTLNRPIPVVFSWDWHYWIIEMPKDLAREYSEAGGDLNHAKFEIREIVSKRIEKIVVRLEKSDVSYVNIVKGKNLFDYLGRNPKKAECIILPISEFIDKFYRMIYNNTIRFLNGEQVDSRGMFKVWE
jgi:hypothetical protein